MDKPARLNDVAGDAAEVPARAMRVASVLRGREGDQFAKAGKLIEVRFVKGQSLSLTASRLLALMILTAAGDAWRDTRHRMRKTEIRRGHKSNERIVDMLEELHRTLFAEDDNSWRGKRATKRFSLIQASWEEVEDDTGAETGWIEWQFTPEARKLIQESETYAVMNRQAVLGFRSSYALKLYEEGALRLHRRQPVWRVDMVGLRAALGIDPDKYKDFAQLRRKVLTVAKAEIDQLAHYHLEWTEVKRGRSISEIAFHFIPKDAPAQIDTVVELSRHSVGRTPRREGSVEAVVLPDVDAGPLPAPVRPAAAAKLFSKFPDGRLAFSETADTLRQIAREHGGGWDADMIANAYRVQMGERLMGLSGAKLVRSWTGFCQGFVARRGRP